MKPGEYRKICPNGKRICAELRKREKKDGLSLLKSGEMQAGLSPFTGSPGWYERTEGYIPVRDEAGSECCVRILVLSPVRIALVSILTVLLTCIALLAFRLFTGSDERRMTEDAAVGYRQDGLENTDPEKILLPVPGNMSLREGGRYVNTILPNPSGNDCFFEYTITLDNSREVIYQSGLIRPGKALIGFYLNRELEEGEYAATVRIRTSDPEDYGTELNGGEYHITITVYR